jgi:hypothetical protein
LIYSEKKIKIINLNENYLKYLINNKKNEKKIFIIDGNFLIRINLDFFILFKNFLFYIFFFTPIKNIGTIISHSKTIKAIPPELILPFLNSILSF